MLKKFFQMLFLNSFGQVLYGISNIFIFKIIPTEQYGALACVMSFASFCSGFVTCGYDIPILYEKDESRQKYSIVMCLSVSLFVTCCLSMLCIPLKQIIFKNIALSPALFFFIFILILCWANFDFIIRKAYTRKGLFKTLSHMLFFNYILRTILPIILVLLNGRNWVYCLLGELIAFFVSDLIFYIKNRNIFWGVKLHYLLSLLKFYKGYFSYQLPSVIISNLNVVLIPLSCNFLFGARITGEFSFVYKILMLPLTFLDRVFGDFYQKELSDALRLRNVPKVFSKYSKVWLTCSTFFIFIGLIIGSFAYNQFIFIKEAILRFNFLSPLLFLVCMQILFCPLCRVMLISLVGINRFLKYNIIVFSWILLSFLLAFFQIVDEICYFRVLFYSQCICLGIYFLQIYLYIRTFLDYSDNKIKQ